MVFVEEIVEDNKEFLWTPLYLANIFISKWVQNKCMVKTDFHWWWIIEILYGVLYMIIYSRKLYILPRHNSRVNDNLYVYKIITF